MKMVFGVVRPEMTMNFGSKEVEPMPDEGVVHGQPTYCFRAIKNSPDCLLDQNCPSEFACMLLPELDSMDGV